MASVQEYIERQSDNELRGSLFLYCMGGVDIPIETAFLICKSLAKRNPELPDPHKLFLDLCRKYC